MEAQIPILLRIHMTFFKIIGYCGLSWNNNLKPNLSTERWFILWSFLLLIGFNMTLLTALLWNEELFFNNDAFGYFNDIMKVVFADMAVTISYMETIFRKSEILKFWETYSNLQNNTNQVFNKISLKSLWKNRRFLGIFYGCVLAESSAMIFFVIFQPMKRQIILFNVFFMPFTYAVHLRNMQFILYIEVIRSELEYLRSDLSLMTDYTCWSSNGCSFQGFEEFLRKKLLEKQKNYQMIYKMYEHFQNGFGFSIIAVILMVYVRVLVDAYFGYYVIYREWNTTEIVLLIPACLQIPSFLITSKNCMDVVKFITYNLHSITSRLKNQNATISTQVQNFSLQILHQRICINGIGISRMDGYMLTRAIGSVTTYMIFFIQFMPKFTNIQIDKQGD